MIRALAVAEALLMVACGCDGGRTVPDGPSCAAVDEQSGEATYYDADGSGACSFDASADRMVAAINGTDYAGSAMCGACAEVEGPAGSAIVRIVDSCPGCEPGDLDLSREAFEQIAALSAGRVPITWRRVPCAVDGPVRYRIKDGSNPYWSAVQVRNHRHAIATVEARRPGGDWRTLPRQSYNYFVDSDGVGETIDVRVTDVEGFVVEDHGIPVVAETEVAGAAQLEACE